MTTLFVTAEVHPDDDPAPELGLIHVACTSTLVQAIDVAIAFADRTGLDAAVTTLEPQPQHACATPDPAGNGWLMFETQYLGMASAGQSQPTEEPIAMTTWTVTAHACIDTYMDGADGECIGVFGALDASEPGHVRAAEEIALAYAHEHALNTGRYVVVTSSSQGPIFAASRAGCIDSRELMPGEYA